MARTGIVLYHGVDSGEALREYGRLAEESGFESLWVTERYFHEETFSTLGFLAAATKKIKLGVGVANPYTRHPALTAMASATLDRISGGRFVLGLGRSDRSVVEGKMGIPYDRPRTALKEAVEIIRGLTSGQEVSFEGEVIALKDARLAVEGVQGRVPIYLGAIGRKALRLAGAIADGVLLNAYSPVEYVRYAVGEVRSAAEESGRDPADVDIACMLVVRLTDITGSTGQSLKERIVRLLAEPHVGEVLLEKGGFDPEILSPLRRLVEDKGEVGAVDLIGDEMVDAFYLVGTLEHRLERVVAYREAGVDLPLLLPRLGDFRQTARMAALQV